MFPLFSIAFVYTIIVQLSANPVLNYDNATTTVDNLEIQSNFSCNRNVFLISNQSLFELLNTDRLWFVLARTTFIFGEQTWKNTFMETITSANDTVHLEFVGENSNGSCARSERVEILPDVKTNRVSIKWKPGEEEGFLEMIFLDETLSLFKLCYAIDLNQTDLCANNRSEQLIVQNNQLEYKGDPLSWLQPHCVSLDRDDFFVNDDSKKCLLFVTGPEIVEVNTTEHVIENINATINDMLSTENMDQENVTVTTVADFEFTTRTNRTNRLEILEEFYNNATEEIEPENTTVVEMKEIIVLAGNASSIDDINGTNMTIVEEIVLEPVANITIDSEAPLIVLHKGDANETEVDDSSDSSSTTVSISTMIDSTDVDMNVTLPAEVTTVNEKQILNETTTVIGIENTTVSITEEYKTSTMEETTTTTELTTTTEETTTVDIPDDCPVLQDCPFESCTYGRKYDSRGCPTCNCLYSTKSNETCPTLTCQTCLYGHHTDSNGCPICQCQTRPYPSLGERCPQLNCEPCYFGTVKDEYHCDTCVCIRPNIQECPVLNCTYGPCKYGSIKDEDDCPTCDCLLPIDNTTEVNCSTSLTCPSCHLGYVKDANGCETCQCKLRGNAPCLSMSTECQCDYGSYLNADGCETCSCLPDPKEASRQACWDLANQANYHNISGPKCASDGSFYAQQCDKITSKCSCVTPSGIHIKGFQSRPEENVNCACAVELYQVSSLRMIGHHLSCLSNGNYAPIQCDGRYCSCVDEDGKPIGPSVSVQNRDQLRCVGVYQQLHPERFLLRQATIEGVDASRLPYGISSSLCLKHLEQVRNANVTDEHILIPVCDANGLYSSVQCDKNERYCWCVDKKTGVEMDGTRRLNARPNCEMN